MPAWSMHTRPPHGPLRHWIPWGTALTALLIGVPISMAWLWPASPRAAFDAARDALSRARSAEAATYAPDALARAEAAWQTAMAAWQAENDRWFLRRDYAAATQRAAVATGQATAAADRAVAARDSLRAVAASGLPRLRTETDRLKRQLDGLPFDRSRHAPLSTARSLLADAERALDRHDYQTAAHNVEQATAYIDSVNTRVTTLLHRYLADLPAWKQWHNETVAWSARHRAPAIVVDKLGRRCLVYVAGTLHASYTVDFGPRWLGDKQHEGDLATPEGRYYVTRKLGKGETIYHRALLINYPNDADRRRFEEAKRRGDLPPEARIGGLIELHGRGGRGADWTRGCVALRNEDIEALFRLVPVGTPVTIVGALDASNTAAAPPPPATGRSPTR